MSQRGPARSAFLSAVVALGLFAPLVGLVTTNGDHGLFLVWRPVATAVVVGLVFFGRLATLSWRTRGRSEARQANRAFAEWLARSGKYVTPVLLVLAVALPFTGSRYYIDLGTLVLTYIMLGWGLNIVVGLAGLLDLGYVAFYAVGAYPMRCWRRVSGWDFGCVCRWRGSLPRCGACCWDFRCCGCAATTWRSLHWRLERSSASC